MKLMLEKQNSVSKQTEFLALLGALGLVIASVSLILLASNVNPLQAFTVFMQGTLGSGFAIQEVLAKATPLILVGLGVAVALQANYWNIGAEGQYVFGACCATGTALFLVNNQASIIAIPSVIVAGFVGGMLWGLLPAVLKVKGGVNEIITTLMMNYIALSISEYLYFDLWKDPQGRGFPGTAVFSKATWLPKFTGRIHIGLLIAVVAVVVVWLILSRAKLGYQMRVVGGSLKAARYAGIPVMRTFIIVALLSAGLSGLAGMGEVAGVSHKLQNGIASGYGFTAIIIAFLGKRHPFGVVLASFFIAALLVGTEQLQIAMGVPAALGTIIQGVTLMFLIAGDVFVHYRLRVIGGYSWKHQ